MSCSMIALYGCLEQRDGSFLAAWVQTRIRKSACGGAGFSTHSVPSLSNVAIRSAGSAQAGPGVVTASTKPAIACFAAPLLQLLRYSLNVVPPSSARAGTSLAACLDADDL